MVAGILVKNQKVEDMLGANQPQWHAVSVMDRAGHAVVAWDDQRDGSPGIWFSEFSASGWSDNDNPAGASGKGSQSHPSMVFNSLGQLHLVCRDRQGGVTSQDTLPVGCPLICRTGVRPRSCFHLCKIRANLSKTC